MLFVKINEPKWEYDVHSLVKVSLINDGPVTIILDSEELKKSRHAK